MKAGIIGMGSVGRAAALAAMQRGSATELVLVNRHAELSQAVALDLGYGAAISLTPTVRSGGYDDLANAGIVVIAAGVNEKHGGATKRADPAGRLRLLEQNIAVLRDIVPPLAEAAPDAVIVIATDPPDPLADVARSLAPGARILSTGTWLDSLRFRTHLAEAFAVSPRSVDAIVLGEHGTSELLHWSAAAIGGMPWHELAARCRIDAQELKRRIEEKVRYANINIIDVTGASQYGIGIVIARIIEAVLRDEKIVVPVGAYRSEHGVTFSLPTVLGSTGAERTLAPRLDRDEQATLERSIATLRNALADAARLSSPASKTAAQPLVTPA
jgi:L-lactate dehydrogenase